MVNIPSSSGLAKDIMSWGRISGTPPTRVETTYRPAHAASKMAIPNDSVSDVFRKMDPRTRTCRKEEKKTERCGVMLCYESQGILEKVFICPPTTYVSHITMPDWTEELYAVLQEMSFSYL
jgi:hypothetical protein